MIGAIESTMQDFIIPITERAIKVAVVTTEQIVKKVARNSPNKYRLKFKQMAMGNQIKVSNIKEWLFFV